MYGKRLAGVPLPYGGEEWLMRYLDHRANRARVDDVNEGNNEVEVQQMVSTIVEDTGLQFL